MRKEAIKNAGWIIGCKIVKAVLTLIATAITARYLGVNNYGLINYASSIVAFFVPIMQLGLNATLAFEVVSRPEDEGKVVGTSMTMTTFSSILCIVGVFAFASIANASETEVVAVCSIYSVLLLFQALEIIDFWFQAKLMSKLSSLAMLISYFVLSIVQIALAVLGAPVTLFALSYSLDFLIIDLILIYLYKKKSTQKLSFSFFLAKRLFKRSKYFILSSIMIVIFAQTDKIMLKLMIGNSATGVYSAANTCALMVSFVFAAIINSVRPEIYNNRKISQEKYEKSLTELYSVIIYASIFVCVAMSLFAPLIIGVMYGAEFSPAIGVLRISVWMTVFSYLGSVRDIWVLAENKQKYLWLIYFLSAILNVVLNFIFIPIMQESGAAIASVATQIFANFVIGFILKPFYKNNLIMIKSLNPKHIKDMLASLKK